MSRKTKHLIVWVSDDQHAFFHALAKRRRQSVADLLRTLINRGNKALRNEDLHYKDACATVKRELSA